MMSERNNGGPAFPWCGDLNECPSIFLGMTLRDWFAGQALAGLTANPEEAKGMSDRTLADTTRIAATAAYLLADAMLKERSK